MERQLGNKTGLTIDEGGVRSYQCNFMLLQPNDFSIRVDMLVGRLRNKHVIIILATAKHTKSSPNEPAHLQLTT